MTRIEMVNHLELNSYTVSRTEAISLNCLEKFWFEGKKDKCKSLLSAYINKMAYNTEWYLSKPGTEELSSQKTCRKSLQMCLQSSSEWRCMGR